jgi:hypothetical protein
VRAEPCLYPGFEPAGDPGCDPGRDPGFDRELLGLTFVPELLAIPERDVPTERTIPSSAGGLQLTSREGCWVRF